jgi:hypothetical protein
MDHVVGLERRLLVSNRNSASAHARSGRGLARIRAPTSADARPPSALGAGGRRLAPLATLGRRSGESGRPDLASLYPTGG